jgi:putative superfamily III holin-X
MALDHLQNSELTRALTELLADLAELVQKELQLAKTEITEKITARLRASAWMVAAGVLGMVAALLIVEAAVFAIASFGLALYWSASRWPPSSSQEPPPPSFTGVPCRKRNCSRREPPNRSPKTSRQPRNS